MSAGQLFSGILLIHCALGGALQAQARAIALKPATATLDHEFTRISSLRELSDGRLLLGEDGLLMIADLRTGEVRQVGARGAGPLEYRDVMTLIPLANDTTVMADNSNGRLLFLHGDRIVRVTPVNDTVIKLLGSDLRGADARGRLLARRQMPAAGFTVPRQRNRAAFVRVDRVTQVVDTITLGKGMEMEVTPVGDPAQRSFRTMTVIFGVEDPAWLFPDGWTAVARQEPYRIDWYPPSGPARLGKPIEPNTPRVTEAEKADWRRRQEEYSGKPLPPLFATLPFAEFVPPFVDDLYALPDGRLLVPRHPWSGSRLTVLDVIDRQGDRVGTLQLAANERVVGVGRQAIYIVARDDDGIQRLRRHPWG